LPGRRSWIKREGVKRKRERGELKEGKKGEKVATRDGGGE